MNTKILQTIIALLLLSPIAIAQEGIKVTNTEVRKSGGELLVNIDLNFDRFYLSANDMATITPVITSNNGQERVALKPVILCGRTRYKVVQRAKQLGNTLPNGANDYPVTLRENRKPQSVRYTEMVAMAEWMRDAGLSLETSFSGCANCDKGNDHLSLIERIIREPYLPQYRLTYIMPSVEPIKNRADEYTAQLNFRVAKHDIVRELGNNAQILDKANEILEELSHNSDLKVTNFEMVGWASPEGNQHSNQALSERRANSFANYLIARHGIDRSKVQVRGGGEDWNGVRKLVEQSSLADKEAVLRIIDSGIDYDARDAELWKLSKGATYRTMLRELYPQVRRTVYKIAYEVRAFDVEEAKQIIKTNPKLLSLNEMYLVAKSYPAESRDFREVFDIAARLYPEEPLAIVNASAADIEGGNYQAAIARMQKIASDPRVWNNLGIAYAQMKDYPTAKSYFEKAKAEGDQQASHNLEELEKVLEEL